MKKKQLTALLLSAAMALSLLSGCGGNAASSGSTASQENAGETESQGIREYTAFFAVPGTEINDDNEIQAAIADITGARVKETWLTGQTAQEAVGTMIAGGEYPDFIDGSDGQIQLYEAGALVALDDYLDKYPNIKEFYSDAEWDKVRQEDGKIYWIPPVRKYLGKRHECRTQRRGLLDPDPRVKMGRLSGSENNGSVF